MLLCVIKMTRNSMKIKALSIICSSAESFFFRLIFLFRCQSQFSFSSSLSSSHHFRFLTMKFLCSFRVKNLIPSTGHHRRRLTYDFGFKRHLNFIDSDRACTQCVKKWQVDKDEQVNVRRLKHHFLRHEFINVDINDHTQQLFISSSDCKWFSIVRSKLSIFDILVRSENAYTQGKMNDPVDNLNNDLH